MISRPEWYVEIVREDCWRYRLVLCAENHGRIFRHPMYRPIRGRANAEQRARGLLTDLFKESPEPEVVAVARRSLGETK